ncbi:helix-turn-helix domain-containing protein [Rhizobiaceae sp. 2RAB30]
MGLAVARKRASLQIARHHLRAWRKHFRLTQGQLAQRSGFSTGLISQLESGRIQFSEECLRRIGRALHIPASFILGNHPDHPLTALALRMRRLSPDQQAKIATSVASLIAQAENGGIDSMQTSALKRDRDADHPR